MKIIKDTVVAIDFTLKDSNGKVLDTSDNGEPLYYLHGHRNIIPGLEKALEGKSAEEEFKASFEPAEAYGEVSQSLIMEVPKDQFKDLPDLKEGMEIQAQTNEGSQIFKVLKVEDKSVIVDGNHPLAGQTLFFDVKVKSVRLGLPEEISHGHVHGPGGHKH